jgi:ATP-dependent DNA helicase RecG
VTRAEAETVARERLDAVAGTLDGFELARVDLELRQEGDVLGAIQSGRRTSLKLLRVTRDGDVIADARDAAAEVLGDDPELAAHPALAAAVRRRLDDEASEYLSRG